jgi:hypothetical protein
MKASRGCENLKAQAVGKCKLGQLMPLLQAIKTLKGQKPQGRRCYMQRLGAWAASEEERKAHERILKNNK